MVQCDRCSTSFTPPEEYLELKYETMPRRKSMGARVAYLCPTCKAAFDEWLNAETVTTSTRT